MAKSKQPKEVCLYRIRDKETGLFSCGTGDPIFTKIGKIWVGLGPLKNHLHMLNEKALKKYLNCEILETKFQDTPCDSFSIEEYIFEKHI